MYRKTDTIITALFNLKEGIFAPFSGEIVKIDENLYIMNSRSRLGISAVPFYIHSFKFVTHKNVSEAQKFLLKFPDADEIKTVADKLRYYRYKRGLYQNDVADYLGIDRCTYRDYETVDRDYYPADMMDKIAELFEVDVYVLLDEYNKFLYDGQGKYIKELRKQLNITQKELAKMMGVELGKVKRWEQDKVRMFKSTYKNIIKLEEFCRR